MNFQFDVRKVIITIFIMALPLISIDMQRSPDEAPWYVKPFTWTLSTMQATYSGFSFKVRNTADLYLNLWGTNRENKTLRRRNNELLARQKILDELELENARLRKLLSFQKNSQMNIVVAEVIGRDLLSSRDTITINRGTSDGLKPWQAVISVDGVVGYIYQPSKYTSQILVLTDRYAVIDSITQRSRAHGIMEGTNEGFCHLRHLGRADDVKVGDLIVTSGLGNVFPKGFPVGKVTQVKKSQYGVTQNVDVKPVVNPAQLEEIFVIIDAAPPEVEEAPQVAETEAPE